MDADAYNHAVNRLYRSVSDMEESDELPHLHIDRNEVHFGKILLVVYKFHGCCTKIIWVLLRSYQQPATRVITLKNRSKVCDIHSETDGRL